MRETGRDVSEQVHSREHYRFVLGVLHALHAGPIYEKVRGTKTRCSGEYTKSRNCRKYRRAGSIIVQKIECAPQYT